MADIKISELSSAAILQDADNLELSQDISGTLQSTKVNLLSLGKKIASAINYTSELKTTDKTLTGAINEKVGWVENAFLGAKNLNSTPYYHSSGRVNNYVTWTVNDDGSITANGTASGGNSTFACHSRIVGYANSLILPNGEYIINGCASGGGSNKYRIEVAITKNGSYSTLALDTGEGASFTVNGDDNYNDKAQIQIVCTVYNGVTASNLVFKPMIRLANDTDATWKPYAPTNRELQLTKPNPEAIATVEYSPTRANHSQGDLIMYNGNLYKCLSAITSGSTLTVGTNIQATNVTSEMGSAGWTDVTGTLTGGTTSITLSDASITTSSTIDVYTDIFGVNPTSVSVVTGSVTLTFEARYFDLGVKVRVS